MLNRLEDLIKQVKREESLKKEAEMEALHYQLNPHFLYNTLNTIKWVAKIHKTPQISEVVSALVRLLQASLGKKGEFITLREEIGLTRDYMEIQKFRYGDRIQIVYGSGRVDTRLLGTQNASAATSGECDYSWYRTNEAGRQDYNSFVAR